MPLEKTLRGFGAVGPSSTAPTPNGTLDLVFSASYEELRRLAAAVKHRDAHATVGPRSNGRPAIRQLFPLYALASILEG
jgi:hypothetical protein